MNLDGGRSRLIPHLPTPISCRRCRRKKSRSQPRSGVGTSDCSSFFIFLNVKTNSPSCHTKKKEKKPFYPPLHQKAKEKPFYPPLHQKVKKTLQLAFQASLSSPQLQIPFPSLPNSPFFLRLESWWSTWRLARWIAFFEEETGTAKLKSTSEKMLDGINARDEELQRLPSIQSRIAFFEAARRQQKTGEEKQIQDHQENLMGGVAQVSSDYRNRRMNATILIQRHIKRWMAQRKFKERHKAALALQTAIRGFLARRNYDARRKFVVRRSLQSYLEEELEQERCALAKNAVNLDETKTGEKQIQARCALAKNVGSSVVVKTGKESSFKKLKACFESCKNHNKPQLHEMKATNEKNGRTEPKGWKRWWESRFSRCFVPRGRKFDDRSIGCCLVRNHCTVLEEMEVANHKEIDVCHDSFVNLDDTKVCLEAATNSLVDDDSPAVSDKCYASRELAHSSVLPSKIHTSDGTLVWQHRPCPSEICTLQSTLPNQPQHHISEAGLSLSSDEKAAFKTAHLELKREWYAVAKKAGFPVNMKVGSPFQKLESRLKSWREHCKHGLHEKAEVEKQEISKPKGWKRWRESSFSSCFVPKGKKFDDRCKGSVQFQSAIGCRLVRNHCTVLEEMEVANHKEIDVCHDSSVNLDDTKVCLEAATDSLTDDDSPAISDKFAHFSVLPSKIHTSDGTLVWQHRPCPSEICTLQSTLPKQPRHHISEAGLSLSSDEKEAPKTSHLELKQEWYAVAKKAGFPIRFRSWSPDRSLGGNIASMAYMKRPKLRSKKFPSQRDGRYGGH